MPIVVPGKDYTRSWNALADVFGNYAQTRDDAYQRQRQETLDAQRLAAHEQSMINAKLLGDTRQFGLDELQATKASRLTPEQQAEHWGTITGPKLPSSWEGNINIDPDRLEQGSSSSERNMSMVRLARDSKRDTILNLNTLNSAQINLQQEFRAGRIDEARYIKLNQDIEIAKRKEYDRDRKADRLEKEAAEKSYGATKRQYDVGTLMGAPRIPHAVQTGPETMDSSAGFDTSITRADPRGVTFNRALEDILLSGKDLTTSQQGRVDLRRKQAGLADVTSGKTFWDSLKESSGYNRKNYEDTLAETMRNTSVDLVDPSGRSNIDEDEYTDAMRSIAKSNILEAARSIYKKNPNVDPYDILNWISGDPNRYLSIESKIGDDDVIPMSIRKIVDKYLETLSQRSTTNTSNTSTGRAHTDSTNPLNL